MQKLRWMATDDVKYEDYKLKSEQLDVVHEHASKIWNKTFDLGPNIYPNSRHCSILEIKYELEIKIDADGFRPTLDIPLVIGDIQYNNEKMNEISVPQLSSMEIGLVPLSEPKITNN